MIDIEQTSEVEAEPQTEIPAQQWLDTADENAARLHIFQKQDRQELLVPVPEWDMQILIRALSGTARSNFIAFQLVLEQMHKGTGEYWKRLWFELALQGCMHPKTKKPIFRAADRDTLMDEHNGLVIEMLGKTVQMFSQIDASSSDRARKNLQSIQNSTATIN